MEDVKYFCCGIALGKNSVHFVYCLVKDVNLGYEELLEGGWFLDQRVIPSHLHLIASYILVLVNLII